jgi:LuxR family transcriptional regulator, positive regulator of biofilm formation
MAKFSCDHMSASKVNILIDLSSKLLSEALFVLLKKNATNCQAVVAHSFDQSSGFTPDTIIVDAAVLGQTRKMLGNSAKIILIDTGLDEEQVIRLLFTHKLDGVISTNTDTELFLKALHAVGDGQIWVDNGKLKAMLQDPLPSAKLSEVESYSKRERGIVLLVAKGFKNREIASELNISEQTVKTHISRILKKANVVSRAQLVPLASIIKLQ